ncbi:MAG: hypothetical protein IIY21_22125 [Clostridiales bacterium]|nr:hypothetical protein [Clostridiales bacterium]
MNKRDRKIVEAYEWSDKGSLYGAYRSFSQRKAEAWEYCERLYKEKGGHGLKVIGANSSFFSAGFMFEEDGRKKLMYITKGDDRVIDLED